MRSDKKPYFWIVRPPYFGKQGTLKRRQLLKAAEFSINKKAYEKCEKLVEKYLKGKIIGTE